MMSVLPAAGPCLRCLFREPPAPGSLPTCDTLGVLATAPALVAAIQATEALKILTGTPPVQGVLSIDLWRMEFQSIFVARQPDCPACARHEYSFLEDRKTSHAVRLCGRDIVQISPPEPTDIDLEGMARTLAVAGRARSNGFLLDFRVEDYELVVFRDGRMLVKGTSDPAIARALVARYLGA